MLKGAADDRWNRRSKEERKDMSMTPSTPFTNRPFDGKATPQQALTNQSYQMEPTVKTSKRNLHMLDFKQLKYLKNIEQRYILGS